MSFEPLRLPTVLTEAQLPTLLYSRDFPDYRMPYTVGGLPVVRLFNGAFYVRGSSFSNPETAEEWKLRKELYLARCLAAADYQRPMKSGRKRILTGISAAVFYGFMPLNWPKRVDLLSPTGRSYRIFPFRSTPLDVGFSPLRRFITCTGAQDGVIQNGGILITDVWTTLAICLLWYPPRVSLPIVDQALRAICKIDRRHPNYAAQKVAKERILARIGDMAMPWNRQQAETVVAFADGLAENPAESVSRLSLLEIGMTPMILQQRRRTRLGEFFLDMFWKPANLAIEFDGESKLKMRFDAVKHEKEREDELRSMGLNFLRFSTDDLYDSHEFHRKVRLCLNRINGVWKLEPPPPLRPTRRFAY